jgi:hypothetical protein
MKRRELVILALAAVGALYAVWSLFLAPAPGAGSAAVHLDRDGLTKTASEVRDLVAKSQPSALEAFTLARAISPFPRDPFHRATSPGDIQATGNEPQAAFVYSGYLKMGGEVFAIINGMEYRIGEELEVADHFLTSIERNKVTIEHRIPGQASSGQIVAPLSEVETALDKKESTGNGTAR